MSRQPRDPTQVTAQPALTGSTGRRWLIWGALLGAVALVVLGLLVQVEPVTALIGCGLVVLLYIAMVVVRVAVRPHRARLLTLAWLLGAMAACALVCVLLVGAVARLTTG
ncbi:hypothetical protein PU630_11280 [Microbacterium horticulturae]|uniref:Uncharacterized protein n=1 Tax=Microbacterium horticulturae TaxID=3028316 RepID=A0ABY8BUG7_9MICO|nr:hypothetical protein [Microbacterium sp. KACC 23027]WEG07824.1 hypothetical protein PU630_11280 [Microbacterium sp. KACC 23027]